MENLVFKFTLIVSALYLTVTTLQAMPVSPLSPKITVVKKKSLDTEKNNKI